MNREIVTFYSLHSFVLFEVLQGIHVSLIIFIIIIIAVPWIELKASVVPVPTLYCLASQDPLIILRTEMEQQPDAEWWVCQAFLAILPCTRAGRIPCQALGGKYFVTFLCFNSHICKTGEMLVFSSKGSCKGRLSQHSHCTSYSAPWASV